MPKFKQFGAPAVLNSGLQYICVEIVQANHLPSSDDNGYTDAFFTVEWEGMVQKTKVPIRVRVRVRVRFRGGYGAEKTKVPCASHVRPLIVLNEVNGFQCTMPGR